MAFGGGSSPEPLCTQGPRAPERQRAGGDTVRGGGQKKKNVNNSSPALPKDHTEFNDPPLQVADLQVADRDFSPLLILAGSGDGLDTAGRVVPATAYFSSLASGVTRGRWRSRPSKPSSPWRRTTWLSWASGRDRRRRHPGQPWASSWWPALCSGSTSGRWRSSICRAAGTTATSGAWNQAPGRGLRLQPPELGRQRGILDAADGTVPEAAHFHHRAAEVLRGCSQ